MLLRDGVDDLESGFAAARTEDVHQRVRGLVGTHRDHLPQQLIDAGVLGERPIIDPLIDGQHDVQFDQRRRIPLVVVDPQRGSGGEILAIHLPTTLVSGDQRLQFVLQRAHRTPYRLAGVRFRHRRAPHGIMVRHGDAVLTCAVGNADPCGCRRSLRIASMRHRHRDADTDRHRRECNRHTRRDDGRPAASAPRYPMRRATMGPRRAGAPTTRRPNVPRQRAAPANIVSQTVASICEVRSAARSCPRFSVITARATLVRPSDMTTK